MTYPASTAVAAGQPTLAAHYNNLRNDAMYIGQDSANAASLGAALTLFQDNLVPELLDTDRIRIPATVASPATVMVAGYLLQNTSNADLATGGKPSGAAATWYLFAQRTAGSPNFTLAVNSSSTVGTDQKLIGRFYWDGSKIVPETIRTELSFTEAAKIDFHTPMAADGRLTLTSGTPVTMSNVSGGTVYYTPYKGNRIALYTGGVWRLYTFTEISVSLTGIAAGTNVDIFIYDNAGTLTLESTNWSNDTTRVLARGQPHGLILQAVLCKYKDYPNEQSFHRFGGQSMCQL